MERNFIVSLTLNIMKNIFLKEDSNVLINPIHLLTPDSKGIWGK